jgi:hypothetical protein
MPLTLALLQNPRAKLNSKIHPGALASLAAHFITYCFHEQHQQQQQVKYVLIYVQIEKLIRVPTFLSLSLSTNGTMCTLCLLGREHEKRKRKKSSTSTTMVKERRRGVS